MPRTYRLFNIAVFNSLMFVAFCPVKAAPIPTCPTASLASYVANETTVGCAVGNYTFFQFAAPTPATSGNGTAISPTEILVTPVLSGAGSGFTFSAPTNSGNGTLFYLPSWSAPASVTYYINYSVDPPAPIIGGADLSIDPPSGNVVVTQNYCTDPRVTVPNCPSADLSQLTVTPDPANTNKSVTFPNPSAFVNVDTDISLTAAASLDAVEALVNSGAATATPEPSALLLTSVPLLLVFLARRKRA